MHRRRAVLAGGVFGLAGCLDFQEGSGDDNTPSETDDPPEEPEIQDSSIPTYDRTEAINRAAQFAVTDSPSIVPPADIEPTGITFSSRAAGAGGNSGSGGQQYASDTLIAVPIDDTYLSLGGETATAVRVTDTVADSSVTFTPDSTTDERRAERLDVNMRGDGMLVDGGVELRDTADGTPIIVVEGTWSGDTDLFRRHPFGTHRVELIADDSVIAHTGERIAGSRYAWLAAQSDSSLFITRHSMVEEEWYVELEVGRASDVVGRVEAIHHPDDHVFEFDLSGIDADSGRYDWSVSISESEVAQTFDRYLQLSSVSVDPVWIAD